MSQPNSPSINQALNDISGMPTTSSIMLQTSSLSSQQQHVTIPTLANTGVSTPPSTALQPSAFTVAQSQISQQSIIQDIQRKQEQQLLRVQQQNQNHPQLLLHQQQADQLRLQEQQARTQAEQLRLQEQQARTQAEQLRLQQQPQSNAQQGSINEQQRSLHDQQGRLPVLAGWQSERDLGDRRKMIAKIVYLLQQRKPDAPTEWIQRLPQISKRLEDSLYRTAASFEEYIDEHTLKQRLQKLATDMGKKAASLTQQGQARPSSAGQQQQPQQSQPHQPLPVQPQLLQGQQQPLPLKAPPVTNANISNQPVKTSIQIVNMAEINPTISQRLQPTPSTTVVGQGSASAPMPTAVPNTVSGIHNPIVTLMNNHGGTVASAPASAEAATSASGAPRTTSDRQQVLRHQQQRLLLLRHAAKCPHEDGRCPVTIHCAGMKRLWKHIAECKDQKCLVPHCVSSRYVLSHYHRCRDSRCPVCGPVREAIQRSHEKQKQMQQLKQRHEQEMQSNKPGSDLHVGDLSAQSAVVSPFHLAPDPKRPRLEQNTGTAPVIINPKSINATIPHINNFPQTHAPPNVASDYSAQLSVPSSNHSIVPGDLSVLPPRVESMNPRPQEDHSLINSFTVEEIEIHIKSLYRGLQLAPEALKTKCLEVMKQLMNHQHYWVFSKPVDPVDLGLDDYFQVIKNPMDLGTIQKRLENGVYQQLKDFVDDVHLTFDNAMLYNPAGSVVHNMAVELKLKFSKEYEKLIAQMKADDERRKNSDACALCGCEKLLFEPPVFYCNGMNCPSKRIRRNSYYYVGGNNQYHWCHLCFINDLKETQDLPMGDIVLKKNQLLKKKNDEVHEESWVQCDRCERWIHQICGLFNTRQNKDQKSEYVCPACTIEDRKRRGIVHGTSKTPGAEDLQRTKLSQYLESHVREKVDDFFEKEALDRAAAENIPIEEARQGLGMGGPIIIRQVTSMDRKLEVRERMKKRYAFKNYPSEFNYRCKCITVFQKLDGVDVILFGLYVYEHDDKNPPPNQRAVYISYLDSVHYMRPRKMRTYIYHEILIAYLDYVRRKGFATAHIWACPPLKGDDYILYAKPEDQKTPRDDRLRQWYIDMLIEAQKRGIVNRITNMYDLYFADPKYDATIVPYMEGDYFPAEVENIIKDIEEGKSSKKGNTEGTKKKTNKVKTNTGRSGTRSTGLDEDALTASGIIPLGFDQKSLEQGGHDYVMKKLGETIQPMKESFIVAFLAWEDVNLGGTSVETIKSSKIEASCLPNDTTPFNGVKVKSENDTEDIVLAPIHTEEPELTENGDIPEKGVLMDTDGAISVSNEISSIAYRSTPEKVNDGLTNGLHKRSADDIIPTDPPSEAQASAIADSDITIKELAPVLSLSNTEPPTVTSTGSHEVRDGKFAAMTKKRNLEGQIKTEAEASEVTSSTAKDSQGRIVKVSDDDEEELDCEILNNRQAFLNLCQGNHYQFDHLRRAKHSSMMVLWHLHNREAPKFVQQCAICAREILTGYRYHCPTCPDYDQCYECVSNPNPSIPRHIHALKPIPVASSQQSEMTEAQRLDRKRSIQLHMTLLMHAVTCTAPNCTSPHCSKMKGLLKHNAQCPVKAGGGSCNLCKRIFALLQIHAKQCKQQQCPIPHCVAIRERFRQLNLQQQAMDDRRRQEMNRHYHSKAAPPSS